MFLCPWCPRAESIGEVVYDESELNTLMREKVKLEKRKDEMFAEVWQGKDAWFAYDTYMFNAH
jgi:hypothetical protein